MVAARTLGIILVLGAVVLRPSQSESGAQATTQEKSPDAALRREQPSPDATADSEPFAADALRGFGSFGISAEVPRKPGGQPLSRYEFVAITRHLITLLAADMREVEKHLEAIRMGEEEMPAHLAGGPSTLQWVVKQSWSAARGKRLSWTVNLEREQRNARAANLSFGNFYNTPVDFPDVPPNHRAAALVGLQARRGLFSGYPDGTFRGDQAVTPGEFALVCQRITQVVQRWGTGEL